MNQATSDALDQKVVVNGEVHHRIYADSLLLEKTIQYFGLWNSSREAI